MSRNRLILLVIGASCLVGGTTGWTLLSSSFVYGRDHAARPIPEFLLAYAVVWIGYLLGAGLLWAGSRITLAPVILVGLVARLVLWPSGLIQENDVYRYVLDGQVLLHGGNPYEFSPLEISGAASGSLGEELRSEEAREALGRIGFPYIPTIYPPAAQAVFAAGAWIGGWDWKGQRFTFLAVETVLLGLLLLFLHVRGRELDHTLLYWWNPLVLKEVANSAHLDVLVALFLVAALLLAEIRGMNRPGLAFLPALGFAGAVLSKLYPLVLFPGFLLFSWRRGRSAGVLVFGAATVALTVIAYLPFLEIGWERVFRGLMTYGAEWRMNQGFFSILEAAVPWPRPAAAVLIGLTAVLVPWRCLADTGSDLVRAAYWTLLFWFLIIPTPFPWYAVPLVALLPFLSRREAWPAVVLSGIFGLYYLSFFVEYRGYPESWFAWVRGVEHVAVWAAVAVSLWRGRGGMRSEE